MAEASFPDLDGWIGRSRTTEDEITRPVLRRIAALLDRDDLFARGATLPPRWYAIIFSGHCSAACTWIGWAPATR
jgi:hydroxyacyl-ACP dehydratase HTD2-like protein with hotdog domain